MGFYPSPTVPTLCSDDSGPLAPKSREEECPKIMKVDHLQPSYHQSFEWQAEGWLFMKPEYLEIIFLREEVLGNWIYNQAILLHSSFHLRHSTEYNLSHSTHAPISYLPPLYQFIK